VGAITHFSLLQPLVVAVCSYMPEAGVRMASSVQVFMNFKIFTFHNPKVGGYFIKNRQLRAAEILIISLLHVL
jgi:hypothetical protein